MTNFVICEDDNRFRKKILDYINNYIDMQKLEGKIAVETILCKEVLEYVKKNGTNKNIYILDIDLNDNINGLQLAKRIRKYDICGYIIFVTNHIELSLTTHKYKVRALDFIVKNVDDIKSRLYEAFDVAIDEMKKCEANSEEKKIMIKSGSSIMYLPLNKIICIETAPSDHKLIMQTMNRRIEFYSALKRIREELDDSFYQIHRSCIINIKYIKRISKKKNDMYVLMKNNGKYPLSKKYAKELTEYVKFSS